jgi:hypothetical protein
VLIRFSNALLAHHSTSLLLLQRSTCSNNCFNDSGARRPVRNLQLTNLQRIQQNQDCIELQDAGSGLSNPFNQKYRRDTASGTTLRYIGVSTPSLIVLYLPPLASGVVSPSRDKWYFQDGVSNIYASLLTGTTALFGTFELFPGADAAYLPIATATVSETRLCTYHSF